MNAVKFFVWIRDIVKIIRMEWLKERKLCTFIFINTILEYKIHSIPFIPSEQTSTKLKSVDIPNQTYSVYPGRVWGG